MNNNDSYDSYLLQYHPISYSGTLLAQTPRTHTLTISVALIITKKYHKKFQDT